MEHETTIREVVTALNELAPLEAVLKRGLMHRGGPHYRLEGMKVPASVGEDEMLVFARLIEMFRPVSCFIIGNAFGLSSAVIARVMAEHGGETVVTLDNCSEGDGSRCHEVAEALRQRTGCDILVNRVGTSPEDIPHSVDRQAYDLVFIDGLHDYPQVTRDYHGVKHLLAEDSIVCWHDYWLPGVMDAVATASREGYLMMRLNTSCEMILGTRSPRIFARMQAMFPDARGLRKRLTWFLIGKVWFWFIVSGFWRVKRVDASQRLKN